MLQSVAGNAIINRKKQEEKRKGREKEMEKNGRYIGVVTGLTHEGMGVTRAEGIAVFVPAVCVGDEIEFQVVKLLKNYAYGRLVRLITPSKDRVAAKCPVFPKCGGCVTRTLSYEAEAAAKCKNTEENFKKLGGLDLQAEEMLTHRPDRYRNKAIYPVAKEGEKLVAGFYAQRSHRVIPVSDCLLQPENFAPLLEKILAFGSQNGWKPFDRETGKGDIRHIFIRAGFATDQRLITLITASLDLPGVEILAKELMNFDPGVVGVVLCENRRRDNVLLGEKLVTIAGKGVLEDRLCGLTFSLSPRSFYQVNPVMAEKLYKKAKEFLVPKKEELLLDLYCGAGTIGLSMAEDYGRVIGVEIISEAIQNAKENAARNGIENAEFFCMDASVAAKRLEESGLRPDAVVLDPPRKGCDTTCLDAVLAMAPRKIAMISCNSATAARDAAYLSERGYRITRFAVADLFPRTAHCECVVCLSREKADDYIRISVQTKDLQTKAN